MPSSGRKEPEYYEEIEKGIESQLQSNFRAMHHDDIKLFWAIGELKSQLKKMIKEHPSECGCVKSFANTVPPLDVDVFALITDGTHFELLILEMKVGKPVGLKELSQLIGYCLVSKAKYGLLVNIDNGASYRLSNIFASNPNISKIVTLENGAQHEHNLGFMTWDSATQNFEYSNLGAFKSLSELSKCLISDF